MNVGDSFDHLGEVVFGTFEGLEVHGNGIFADRGKTTVVLDFRGKEVFSDLRAARKCRFRQRMSLSTGDGVEILGVLQSSHDAFFRPGFFGAAIALPADTVQPLSINEDWDTAFARACELSRVASKFEEGRRLDFERCAKKKLIEPREKDLVVNTKLDGTGEIMLTTRAEPCSDDFERLQALAFAAVPDHGTMYLFKEVDARGITGENLADQKYELLVMALRRFKEVQEKPIYGGQTTVSSKEHEEFKRSVNEQLKRLDEDVDYLWEKMHRGYPKPDEQYRFAPWVKAVSIGVVVLMMTIAGFLYMQTNHNARSDGASSGALENSVD